MRGKEKRRRKGEENGKEDGNAARLRLLQTTNRK